MIFIGKYKISFLSIFKEEFLREPRSLKIDKRSPKGLFYNEKGQALVEAAIIMPILIVLILGCIQLGLLVHMRELCYITSRQGARLMTARGTVDREHLKNFFRGSNNAVTTFRDPNKADVQVRGNRSNVTVEVRYSFPHLPWMPPVIPGMNESTAEPFQGVSITGAKCKMIGDVRE